MRRIFFCSTHLLQGLALKQQLFLLFGFFVASLFDSGFIQTFTSASCRCHFHCRQPLRHSLLPVTAIHSLSSASPAVALQFSHLLHLPVTIVAFLVVLLFRRQPLFSLLSPSSACHSFTSASHSYCRLIVILRVPQESYKSGYRPVRYLTNFLLQCSVQ